MALFCQYYLYFGGELGRISKLFDRIHRAQSPGLSSGFRSRGGAKKQAGSNFQYWMYAATGGVKYEMWGTILNGEAGNHCAPPAGDDPDTLSSCYGLLTAFVLLNIVAR